MKNTNWGNQYATNGWFSRTLNSIKSFFSQVLQRVIRILTYVWFLLKLGALGTALVLIGFGIGQSKATYEVIHADSPDTLTKKIETMENDVVNELAQKENKTNIPCIPDDNKAKSLPLKDKVSCGVMQFKISTIQHYYGILKLGSISDQDAVILAIDPVKSKELAKHIIFETSGGIFNWSTNTEEITAKVEVIKELLK